MSKNKVNFIKKLAGFLVLTITLSTGINQLGLKSLLYKASVLEFAQHEPFDGTVYPIEKSVDFVRLPSAQRYAKYEELKPSNFIDVPEYDADVLKTSTDGLKWGNAEHDRIRNAKILYSVPYMGNYKLDGRENVGSHPAVDIKTPENTPVRSIANGTVIKVSNSSSGFGHHVVVQHNNFPALNDSSKRETIYASYSHLNDIEVGLGDVVKKGELIAYSGKTGTATTPHIHFQIDNDKAPWHPFWPFSYKESQEAGLSFFEAINAGLGADKGRETTINPMLYVQRYLDPSNVKPVTVKSVEPEKEEGKSDADDYQAASYVDEVSDRSTDSEQAPVEEEAVAPVVEEEEDVTEAPVVVAEPPVLTFEFEVEDFYQTTDRRPTFRVYARDQYGNDYSEAIQGELVISSVDRSVTASKALLSARDFNSGTFEGKFSYLKAGRDRLKLVANGETYYSDFFDVVDPETSFTDVSRANTYHDAVHGLRDAGVVNGYDDGTFRPNNPVSRVEAAKFIVLAAKLDLKKADRLPFPDREDGAWYSDYIYTLYKAGVINGNADGTLTPNAQVNRAAFFKMLFLAMGEDVREANDGEEWYEPYIEKAQKLDLLNSGKVDASQPMNRAEVADAMWRLMQS